MIVSSVRGMYKMTEVIIYMTFIDRTSKACFSQATETFLSSLKGGIPIGLLRIYRTSIDSYKVILLIWTLSDRSDSTTDDIDSLDKPQLRLSYQFEPSY